LPLTMPLLLLGLPPSLVSAMDPFLRSVIETGYNRPDPNVAGSYPSEPVRSSWCRRRSSGFTTSFRSRQAQRSRSRR
jgi:hypothetical protein